MPFKESFRHRLARVQLDAGEALIRAEFPSAEVTVVSSENVRMSRIVRVAYGEDTASFFNLGTVINVYPKGT